MFSPLMRKLNLTASVFPSSFVLLFPGRLFPAPALLAAGGRAQDEAELQQTPRPDAQDGVRQGGLQHHLKKIYVEVKSVVSCCVRVTHLIFLYCFWNLLGAIFFSHSAQISDGVPERQEATPALGVRMPPFSLKHSDHLLILLNTAKCIQCIHDLFSDGDA